MSSYKFEPSACCCWIKFLKTEDNNVRDLTCLLSGIKWFFENTKELEGKKKYAQDLQKVADEPAMGQTDVDELNKRVRDS